MNRPAPSTVFVKRGGPPRRARRAMTLLELIVAVTVLASLMGVVATIWGQMSGWQRDLAEDPAPLKLRRISEFLQTQWSDRRLTISLDSAAAASTAVAVRLGEGRLEFVTASPALFPDWPLVRAAYIIERESPFAPQDAPARLVYEELRLTNPGVVLDEEFDSLGEIARRRHVLLEDCSSLRWEVWSATAMAQAVAQAALDSSAPTPSPWVAPEAQARYGAAAVIDRSAEAPRDGADQAAATGSSSITIDPIAPTESLAERELVKHTPLRAIRLRGEFQNKEFEWLLVVEASRSSSF